MCLRAPKTGLFWMYLTNSFLLIWVWRILSLFFSFLLLLLLFFFDKPRCILSFFSSADDIFPRIFVSFFFVVFAIRVIINWLLQQQQWHKVSLRYIWFGECKCNARIITRTEKSSRTVCLNVRHTAIQYNTVGRSVGRSVRKMRLRHRNVKNVYEKTKPNQTKRNEL